MDRSAMVERLTTRHLEPVRYRALRDLRGLAKDLPEVVAARQTLMDYEPTRRILSEGAEFWGAPGSPYWTYRGRYWQMIYLGWFGADGRDPRIAPGVESILGSRKWISKHGVQCHTANILAAARRLGFPDHPRVVEETELLAEGVIRDGGLACEAVSYSLLQACHKAIPKPLLSFAEIPPGERSRAVHEACDILVSRLLDHDVHVYVPAKVDGDSGQETQEGGSADGSDGQTVDCPGEEGFPETTWPRRGDREGGVDEIRLPLGLQLGHSGSDVRPRKAEAYTISAHVNGGRSHP